MKIWGDQENEIIVLVHGLLDNAGSFDNLIPLLSEKFCYVCVDLPGHGLSSHIHESIPIHTVDYALSLGVVFDYFKREKYILLGHSLGGQICIFFTMLYPNYVSKLLTIDALAFQPIYPNFYVKKLLSHHDIILGSKSTKSKIKSYTYEECVDKIVESRSHGCFNRKGAEPLVKRMIKETSEGRYTFNFDRKLRMFLSPCANHDNIIELYEKVPIECPFMIVMNDEFSFSLLFVKIYNYLKGRSVPIHIVKGHHDNHMTHPEKISGYINDFLLSYTSQRRDCNADTESGQVESTMLQMLKHKY